jgi:glycerol-3-phosphate acyltransferase PlsX
MTTPQEVLANLRALPTSGQVRVAVDAMGGDHAPDEIVKGALAVAGEHLQVILVGRAERLRPLAAGWAHVSVVDAPDVIGSADEPARAVREAVVSAGSTGAVLAAAQLYIHRLKGVLRPAICVLLPAVPLPVVFLDAGANAEVRPEHLRQFAMMGQVFAAEILGLAQAQVGLLNIGEEPGKGTATVVAAHRLLVADPEIRFYGNVEGRDLLNRLVDVVVTDGFTGNVALKASEGAARAILNGMRQAVSEGSLRSKVGALLLHKDLRRIAASLDPEEYGGSYLLGMNRPVVIAHGNTRARGMSNAVLVAARGASSDLLATIAVRLAGAGDAERGKAAAPPAGDAAG